jgi:hypothetical protein
MLDSPMFTRAGAGCEPFADHPPRLRRQTHTAQHQRMAAEDLIAGCSLTRSPAREPGAGREKSPTTRLVKPTLADCLHEAMGRSMVEKPAGRAGKAATSKWLRRTCPRHRRWAAEILGARPMPSSTTRRSRSDAPTPWLSAAGWIRNRRRHGQTRSAGHCRSARGGLAGCRDAGRTARCALLIGTDHRAGGRERRLEPASRTTDSRRAAPPNYSIRARRSGCAPMP